MESSAALDTGQALKNMEVFLEMAGLALDLTMVTNIQSTDVSQMLEFIFLSPAIKDWESYRVESRPTTTGDGQSTLAQSVLIKSMLGRMEPEQIMLFKEDQENFLISEEDKDVENAKNCLLSRGKSTPELDFHNLIEFMEQIQKEYQVKMNGMTPKELRN